MLKVWKPFKFVWIPNLITCILCRILFQPNTKHKLVDLRTLHHNFIAERRTSSLYYSLNCLLELLADVMLLGCNFHCDNPSYIEHRKHAKRQDAKYFVLLRVPFIHCIHCIGFFSVPHLATIHSHNQLEGRISHPFGSDILQPQISDIYHTKRKSQ